MANQFDKKLASLKEVFPTSVITRIAGGDLPLLPGESPDDYRIGLSKTIKELNASTHLQVYLAEKIFDCVWWMRRLESAKTNLIVNRMASLVERMAAGMDVRGILDAQDWNNKNLLEAVARSGKTMKGLVSEATSLERDALRSLDEQIADRIRALKGLQSAYEALVNRKVMIERLQLQNALLKRDLGALEMDTNIQEDDHAQAEEPLDGTSERKRPR